MFSDLARFGYESYFFKFYAVWKKNTLIENNCYNIISQKNI